MKYIFYILLLVLVSIFIFLNLFFPVEWCWFFTFFVFISAVVKIVESFYTSNEKDVDKYSGDWTLVLTSVLYFVTGLIIILEFYFFPHERSMTPAFLGLMVYIFGVLLRRKSIKTLGNQWAIHVVTESRLLSKPRLIISGPYKYIRHPIYLTYIFDLLGIALLFSTYYSILAILLLNIPSYFIRALHEEKISRKRFGTEFIEYVSSTSLIFPIKFLYK